MFFLTKIKIFWLQEKDEIAAKTKFNILIVVVAKVNFMILWIYICLDIWFLPTFEPFFATKKEMYTLI